MGYKLQKFSTVYPEFVRQFLVKNAGYESLSYAELYERFIRSHYGWADYYAKNLRALGVEAEDIFVNIEPLQKAWAKEHGVSYSRNNWQKEIVLAQVKSFRPDVLFLQDLYYFDSDYRTQLREARGKRTLMLGWQAAPTEDYSVLRDLDVILTCAPHFAEYMRRAGANGVLCLHAFETSILDALPPVSKRDLEFTFIGSFVLRNGFHQDRFSMVQTLMQSTPLRVWGEVSVRVPSRRTRLLSKARAIAGNIRTFGRSPEDRDSQNDFPDLSDELAFAERFHQPVFGLQYYEILASSKITFNSHIDCAEEYAGNMRLFEATGAGACLITDRKVNLAEMFEPDVEVVTYSSVEECSEKVRYLLDHARERESIAAAGQRRVLRDHTFENRAGFLNDLILQALK